MQKLQTGRQLLLLDQNKAKIQQKIIEINSLFEELATTYQYDKTTFNNLAVDYSHFANVMVPSIQGDLSLTDVFYSWWNWLNDYQYKIRRKYS